jgi:phosphoribosylanthranilate isomerase
MMDELSEFVDAFITDTFDPKTGASGATGITHDWSVSHRLVERSDRPVILAGGLTPENVRKAILAVNPAGVDSHTGVEDAAGRKSREKVEKFVTEAQAAYRKLKEDGVGS